MDTKQMVLDWLGWSKLGPRVRWKGYDPDGTEVHADLGDLTAVEVQRFNGDREYIVGRYDRATRRYRVGYDPNISAGPVKMILNVYPEPKS
jgi:hypothetical protein